KDSVEPVMFADAPTPQLALTDALVRVRSGGKLSINDVTVTGAGLGLFKTMVTVEGWPAVTVAGLNDLATETPSDAGSTLKVALEVPAAGSEPAVTAVKAVLASVSVKLPAVGAVRFTVMVHEVPRRIVPLLKVRVLPVTVALPAPQVLTAALPCAGDNPAGII